MTTRQSHVRQHRETRWPRSSGHFNLPSRNAGKEAMRCLRAAARLEGLEPPTF